jgi:glyoxylase-like metal-dependent hydrolase (beta-lactamase superfamily II)
MQVETVVVGAYQTNCCIVWENPDNCVVIDPGSDPEAIVEVLRKHRLTPGAYVLTHGHVDHVSAVADLSDTYPAPVAIHADDLQWAFEEMNAMRPFYSTPRRPNAEFQNLGESPEWTCGTLCFTVISTPGHTPGGICLYMPAAEILFSGDTLFAGSAGRTDLAGGNSRTLMLSLKRLAALPDNVTVYPGHGPSTTIGHEKATNFFLKSI